MNDACLQLGVAAFLCGALMASLVFLAISEHRGGPKGGSK
jgi:hypothetical protein